MRRNYLLIVMFCAIFSSMAQRMVTFKVVDSNYLSAADKLASVKFKGAFSGWADFTAYDDGTNGDATANDGIWTAKYSVSPGAGQEWGATSNGNWIIVGANQKFDMAANGKITGVVGDTVYRVRKVGIKKTITYVVIDSNYTNNTFKLTKVKFKGVTTGWSDTTMYDDGTHGDAAANDGKWSVTLITKEGSTEWGATDNGNWIIKGSNRILKLNGDGTFTGESYGIAKIGALINVTFSVDMSDTIVNTEGVFVTGNFMSFLQSKINDWNKDTLKLTKVANYPIYTGTYKMYAGNYDYKFYNGKGNANDARGENWITAACGNLNGFGQYNRALNAKFRTTDLVLPTYKWNRCTVSSLNNRQIIAANEVSIYPMPAGSVMNVKLAGSKITTVILRSIDGKIVRNITGNSNLASINTKGLQGIYTVEITDNSGRSTTQKVVINQ